MGYSIGGPIGKPGGNNKLFFFYAQEFLPRTGGNDVVRFRMPTALERAGRLLAVDATTSATCIRSSRIRTSRRLCTAADQTACFQDGGVLGRIPADRLYQTGPEHPEDVARCPTTPARPARRYNYAITRPRRASWAISRRSGSTISRRSRCARASSIQARCSGSRCSTAPFPGSTTRRWCTRASAPKVSTVNYSLNPTTFIEATYGRAGNSAGRAGADRPPTSATTPRSRRTDDFEPEQRRARRAAVAVPGGDRARTRTTTPYKILTEAARAVLRRHAGPASRRASRGAAASAERRRRTSIFRASSTSTRRRTSSVSLTKVMGRHTMKTGLLQQPQLKRENNVQGAADNFGALNFQQDAVGTNPFDTSFGFANAAIGSFSSYAQASRYVEGNFTYNNTEGYIQDNWKAEQPAHARLRRALRARAAAARQPAAERRTSCPTSGRSRRRRRLYVAGCVNNVESVHGHQPPGDESR